jgi:hypothetical protein
MEVPSGKEVEVSTIKKQACFLPCACNIPAAMEMMPLSLLF